VTGRPVTFHVPSGVPVPVEVSGVQLADGRVVLSADATAEQWATIEGGLLFNLDSALDDDGQLPPMLTHGVAVSFTAVLGDDAAEVVAGDGGDLLQLVVTAEAGSPLNDTESWFLASATPATGDGYATRFAEADAGPLERPEPVTFRVEYGDDDEVDELPGRLMSLALSFLEAAEIEVDVLAATVAGGVHQGANGEYDLVVHAREEAEQLLAYARCREVIPVERRPEVMELVTRINPQLPGTWLELDLDEGRVSARCTLNAKGTDVTDDTFAENVIHLAMTTMDEYLPAILAVGIEGLEVDAIRAADDARLAEGGEDPG
jgi:hypothetical protein